MPLQIPEYVKRANFPAVHVKTEHVSLWLTSSWRHTVRDTGTRVSGKPVKIAEGRGRIVIKRDNYPIHALSIA